MECNKEEALRAKSLAELKFEQNDFVGAKSLALKAQNLYPELDGIVHMLSVLDIFIASTNKINGEIDWYGVLGVDPTADDETIRKKYKKIVLMVHPDKNKFIGATDAFKLISKSWSLLSDKEKRLMYDQRRGINQKFSTHDSGPSPSSERQHYQHNNGPITSPTENNFFYHTYGPSASDENWYSEAPFMGYQFFWSGSSTSLPSMGNQFYNFASSTTPNTTQFQSTEMPYTSIPTSSYQRLSSFWTKCYSCNMYHEYDRIYLNHTLCCRICYKRFMALEVAPPHNFT